MISIFRFIMDRICEDFGVICSLDPKPMPGMMTVNLVLGINFLSYLLLQVIGMEPVLIVTIVLLLCVKLVG